MSTPLQVEPLHIEIPSWIDELSRPAAASVTDLNSAMGLAIRLSAENIRRGDGGPFGAVVVSTADYRLVAAGVNLVTSRRLSCLHAEVVALSRAQQVLETWDLSSAGELMLVTSCEPCTMCMGATMWSGVTQLACGARGEDAERAGFDEGPKPEAWAQQLSQRGIQVQLDVQRDAAARVLADYAASGGQIYNARGQTVGSAEA